MPVVNKKHYSYSPAGVKAAKKASKEMGMPMMADPKKMPKGKKKGK